MPPDRVDWDAERHQLLSHPDCHPMALQRQAAADLTQRKNLDERLVPERPSAPGAPKRANVASLESQLVLHTSERCPVLFALEKVLALQHAGMNKLAEHGEYLLLLFLPARQDFPLARVSGS